MADDKFGLASVSKTALIGAGIVLPLSWIMASRQETEQSSSNWKDRGGILGGALGLIGGLGLALAAAGDAQDKERGALSNPAKEFSAGNFEVRPQPGYGSTKSFGVWHNLLDEWVTERGTRARAEDVAYYLSQGEGEQIFLMALGGYDQAKNQLQLIKNGGGNIPERPRYAGSKDVLEFVDRDGVPIKISALKRVGDWVAHYSLSSGEPDAEGFYPVMDGKRSPRVEYCVSYKDGRKLNSGLTRKEAFALVEKMGGEWEDLGRNIVLEEGGDRMKANTLIGLTNTKAYMLKG